MPFISLDYSIEDWEWYKDTNTKTVFIHCLLRANWKDGRFMGYEIPRGSFVSSYPQLSAELGLSIQQVRTAIIHLKSTGEITVNSNTKFSVIKINNYNSYQDPNRHTNSQTTVNQQADIGGKGVIQNNFTKNQHGNNTTKSGSAKGEIDTFNYSSNSQATVKQQASNSLSTTIEQYNKGTKKQIKDIKHTYGENEKVLLTDKEFEKLHKDYPNADELIQYLDNYMVEKPKYKSESHNLAIRRWVVDAVNKSKAKPYTTKNIVPMPEYMNNMPESITKATEEEISEARRLQEEMKKKRENK